MRLDLGSNIWSFRIYLLCERKLESLFLFCTIIIIIKENLRSGSSFTRDQKINTILIFFLWAQIILSFEQDIFCTTHHIYSFSCRVTVGNWTQVISTAPSPAHRPTSWILFAPDSLCLLWTRSSVCFDSSDGTSGSLKRSGFALSSSAVVMKRWRSFRRFSFCRL